MMPSSNSAPRNILIVGESIFEEGLADLLKGGIGLKVFCIRYTDELAFLHDVARNQPDAILLNESAPFNPPQILKLLFSISSQAGPRVIIARLSNNMIDVYVIPKQVTGRQGYERQQFMVTEQAELVAVVRG